MQSQALLYFCFSVCKELKETICPRNEPIFYLKNEYSTPMAYLKFNYGSYHSNCNVIEQQ